MAQIGLEMKYRTQSTKELVSENDGDDYDDDDDDDDDVRFVLSQHG